MGERVTIAETAFNRILSGSIAPRPDLSKMMALMQGRSTGSLSLHNTFQHSSSSPQSVSSLGHSSAISASLPFMMGGAAASPLVDSSTVLHHHYHHPQPHHHHHHHPGLRTTGYPSSPATTTSGTALWLSTLQHGTMMKMRMKMIYLRAMIAQKGTSHSFDDPMMPANSDSSDDADD